jgi:periplasmic divalent cation tolerance protein
MIIVYVTYPDVEIARRVSRVLVEQKLVACANILGGHESLYWWDGAVQSENEVAVIYKSSYEKFSEIGAAVKAAHPYEVPCIVSWECGQASGPFSAWVESSVKL